MEIKLMNVMGDSIMVEIPDNPIRIDITVLSGDDILEVFYLTKVVKYDFCELAKLPKRSIDCFGGRDIVYIKNQVDNIELFNSRKSTLNYLQR